MNKIRLLVVPSHVDAGFKSCNVCMTDLIHAYEDGDDQLLNFLQSKLSKYDMRDLGQVNGHFHSLLKIDNYNDNGITDIELLDIINSGSSENYSKLLIKYNIVSIKTTLSKQECNSRWFNFTRIGATYIMTITDEYIELLSTRRTLALISFYTEFIDLIFRNHGLEVYRYNFFKNFLNFIITTKKD